MKPFRIYQAAGFGIVVFALTEISLRFAFGLGTPLLSQVDSYTGYRFQPNQKIVRFGKRIEYNQYSQRSEPITLQKPMGTLRILMVGDSVLNGGNPVDQSQTITELLKGKIEKSGQPVEVLNASAGSWAIGNRLGYLREFGTFQSDSVVLQISTHSFTQTTAPRSFVGHRPDFPDRPPILAVQEVLERYILPQFVELFRPASAVEQPQPLSDSKQQFRKNLEFLDAAISLVRSQHISVSVIFIPDRGDLVPTLKPLQYKSELMQFLCSRQVSVLDVHQAWSKLPVSVVSSYFRDKLHLNQAGNLAVADLSFHFLYKSKLKCNELTHFSKDCSIHHPAKDPIDCSKSAQL